LAAAIIKNMDNNIFRLFFVGRVVVSREIHDPSSSHNKEEPKGNGGGCDVLETIVPIVYIFSLWLRASRVIFLQRRDPSDIRYNRVYNK
jgi:hypothetical protein